MKSRVLSDVSVKFGCFYHSFVLTGSEFPTMFSIGITWKNCMTFILPCLDIIEMGKKVSPLICPLPYGFLLPGIFFSWLIA